ncbi:MAG: hypothetical protein O7I42_22555 [Alphaproteobacteria bacterium]|nr:hypothetical protein [Alphaproteobacteria bacterium]
MKIGSIRTALACAVLWLAIMGLGNAALAAPRCVCRYAGKNYDLGQCVGMNNSVGVRCGCCVRVLNNTSWSFSAGSCGIVSKKWTPRPTANATTTKTVDHENAAIVVLR